jgi:hypothetical protein
MLTHENWRLMTNEKFTPSINDFTQVKFIKIYLLVFNIRFIFFDNLAMASWRTFARLSYNKFKQISITCVL